MEFCNGICANNQVGVNICIESCDTSWVWYFILARVALVYSFCKSRAQVWKIKVCCNWKNKPCYPSINSRILWRT